MLATLGNCWILWFSSPTHRILEGFCLEAWPPKDRNNLKTVKTSNNFTGFYRGYLERTFCLAFLLRCLLSRKLLWFFSSTLPGDLALKNGGAFEWIFRGLRFSGNRARKVLEEIGKLGAFNPRKNSGRKFENFEDSSFCTFSDLTTFVVSGRALNPYILNQDISKWHFSPQSAV